MNTLANAQVRSLGLRRAPADAAVEPSAHLAVVRLFDEHGARLRAFIATCGVSPAQADDILQETFLALFAHLCNRGNADNLRGWLFRVGYRLALKSRQRTRWRERWLLPWHRSADAARDERRDPEQQLLDREARRSLAGVLAALPRRDRHCLHLRAAGLPYRDIADVLNISLGSVAKSLARSTAKLAAVRLRSHR